MHQLCHIDYDVRDIAKAQAFYQGMFGWDFRQFTPTMVVFGQGEDHIGGLVQCDSPHVGKSPSLWFEVEDLEAMKAKAISLGGSAPEENSPVPGVGLSTVVFDLDGNLVGLVQYIR